MGICQNQKTRTALLSWFRGLFQACDLEGYDVLRLRAFLTLGDDELNSLSFIQIAVTFTNDRIEVHEDVSTSVTLNEAIAFRAIEPLNSTLFFTRHVLELLS